MLLKGRFDMTFLEFYTQQAPAVNFFVGIFMGSAIVVITMILADR